MRFCSSPAAKPVPANEARAVEGLAEADVELVVRTDGADASRVVVGFFIRRNQFTLFDDGDSDRIRAFHEVFRRREPDHAVALDDIEHTVG